MKNQKSKFKAFMIHYRFSSVCLVIRTVVIRFCPPHSAVWKNEKFTVTNKKFRQINSLVKTLLSRNFCQRRSVTDSEFPKLSTKI